HFEVTDVYLSDLSESLEAVRSGDNSAVTEVRYS
ncbi:MAG: hypothetical protein ACI9P7_001307, partial [Candidatus Azotimanducaceae bacterium]